MFDKKFVKNFDYLSMLLVLALFSIGMAALASATGANNGKYGMIIAQSVWFVLGLAVFFIALNIDYNIFGSIALYLYVLMLAPLVILVAFPSLGHTSHNATSWFRVGSQQVQPSEFAKIIFILTFARHIDKIREKDETAINKPENLIFLLAHAAVPVLLIMKQPDNGTALVYCVIAASMLFAANISFKYILGALACIVPAVPVFLFFILPRMPKYAANRILGFINPDLDPKGIGWQAMISKLAIGSGRIWGQGLFHGIQSHMPKGGLPVKESDFIFAVLGEELGFVWCAVVVALFVLLLLRFMYIARTSKDFYGSLIVSGVTAMIAFHMFQNIGMTVGLMPITGIPLPFFSYGGSSFLTNMAGVGLVLCVAMRRQKQGY